MTTCGNDSNESIEMSNATIVECEPLKKDGRKKISTTFSLINMIKGMVGPGCFAMPIAFKQAGLWAGFVITFVISAISIACMIKLVVCAQYLCKKNNKKTLDYGQMAEEAFKSSFEPLQKFSTAARLAVNGCIIFLQLGICSVLYIFVVDHAKEFVDYFWENNSIERSSYFFICLPFFITLALIRSIHILSFVCLFGNLFMGICVAIIMYELVSADHIHTQTLPAVQGIRGIVIAAGSILYSLEGMAVVLPLENRMKHPSEMMGYTGVITTAVSLVTLVYSACGFFGYISFGDNVRPSVTLNLQDTHIGFAVKMMLLVVVFVGYLIQQYPLVEMLWPDLKAAVKRANAGPKTVILAEYGFRFGVLFSALAIAYMVPNLDDIIPLVGVTSGMLLALVFPAGLEIVTFLPEWRKLTSKTGLIVTVALDIFYMILGLFFVVTGLQINVSHLLWKDSISHV